MKTRSALQGVLISLCFCSFSSFANQSDHSHGTCSEKFVGTVESVDAKSPFTQTDPAQVTFKVDHSIQGPYTFTRTFEIDPSKYLLKRGESYLLEVSGHEICQLQAIARR